MKAKNLKERKSKRETPTSARSKVALTPKEEALAELDRAVEPLIRTWKEATREHEQAKADRIEADYNKTLDAASAKYERWCKAHGETP